MTLIHSQNSEEAEVIRWYTEGYEDITPDEYMLVSEWADKNRILDSKASGEPGPWRTSRTPYLKDIMDALSPSSPYETIVFMKGAQVGATEAGLNWIGYIIDVCPQPTMIVWPTEHTIKENVRIRVNPLIDSCPTLRAKVSEKVGDKAGADNLFMKDFPGGHLTMAASNSSPSLRSKPICFLMLDEVDEYPINVNQQGDPVNLAQARTRTYSGKRKIYMPSTPTVAGRSRIEDAYIQTDQRRFFVPCPHCNMMQALEFRNLQHAKDSRADVWYECIHCSGKIRNYHKTKMLEEGEWRASAVSHSPRTIGFHLSSLYSPVGMFSWEEIIEKWYKDKDKPNTLKEFTNTVLGETFQEGGDLPEWEKLYQRRESYKIGTVPGGGMFLTAGADVQKDRIEVEVKAWGRNKENWSVDYRVFVGDTANLADDCWRQLDLIMSEGFEHESGNILHIRSLAIDSQYNTQTVLNWCRNYPVGRVIAVRGEDSYSVMISQPTAVDVYTDSKRRKRAMQKFRVGVSIIKMELYGWLQMTRGDVGSPNPPGYCHFPEYPEEYFKQLCSEHYVKVEMQITKKIVGEWRKLRERNEVLDATVYARAAAALMKIDMFRAEHWDQIENNLWPKREKVVTNDNIEVQRAIKPRVRKPRIVSPGIK